jgi:hypothetical protein
MIDEGAVAENIIRSPQRVADHGEVLTPSWLVDDMLELVQAESERIDSRFLEPACGSGNFLVPLLRKKLQSVRRRYRASEFELNNYSLLALMCVYGVELLADNAEECRQNLLRTFADGLRLDINSAVFGAAISVVRSNIIQGDALTFCRTGGEPIVFPEWAYLGHGRFQRRDFRYDTLTQRSSLGGLFDLLETHEIFSAVREYPPMTVQEIAQ